jgi:hypothetical protein
MKAARGLSLTYTRGVDSVTLTAWPGNTGVSFLTKLQAEPSAGSQTSNADFMVVAAELILNSTAITPRIGDTIAATINSAVVYYVVLPTNQGEPAWRWSDEQTRLIYRIHATATPWLSVTVRRPAPTPGAGGLRVANLAAVYTNTNAKFVPDSSDFEVTADRVTTRNKYLAVFADPAVSLLAGDVIDVSGVKYEVTNQSRSGRTSQLPEADCVRLV